MKPLVLDLCCCSGGASMGYHRAGFDVVGVDIVDRPRYPFTFIKADALDVLSALVLDGQFSWNLTRGHLTIIRPTLIHMSWPCQAGCTMTNGTNAAMGWGGEHQQLVPEGRQLAEQTGIPFVIEQPQGHGGLIRTDLRLCMDMFPVGDPPWVQRHRDFELSGFSAPQPKHTKHRGYVRGLRHGVWRSGPEAPYVAAYGNGGGKATVAEMQHALGIDWTDVREELTEAIPPAYTEHIGRAFMDHLDEQADEREARRTGGLFARHFLAEPAA